MSVTNHKENWAHGIPSSKNKEKVEKLRQKIAKKLEGKKRVKIGKKTWKYI